MIKVKVVYMNGKETLYDVEYPKAYIAKIIENENGLMLDQKSIQRNLCRRQTNCRFSWF